MRRYSQRNNLSTLSEINITPLLDLAFVLLIIFIITTPLLENSVNLSIPSSGAANAGHKMLTGVCSRLSRSASSAGKSRRKVAGNQAGNVVPPTPAVRVR